MRKCLFYILILIAGGCTEPYNQETSDYEELLVVQGRITDQAERYTVKLTKTIPLLAEEISNEDLYETNAVVMIMDNNGNTETLVEEDPGIYKTSGNDLIGEHGNTYILRIITESGDEYESEPVELIKGPGLDTILTEYNETYSFEHHDYLKGFDILINTGQFPEKGQNYYLKWDYEEVWQITPFWPTDYFDHEHCWKTELSDKILIESTSSYVGNNLKKVTIHNINEGNYRLLEGYSILIKQYVINESEYQFWRMVKENIEDNGGVFDNVPYNPISNINCVSDPDKEAIGFFSAASISSKRNFFKSPMYDIEFPSYNEGCKSERMDYNYFEKNIIDKSNYYIVFVDTLPDITGGVSGDIVYTRQKRCVDCSVIENTEVIEPDFWNYKIY